MVTALGHAGAELGVLVLPHGSELRVEARAVTVGERVEVNLEQVPLPNAELPQSVVRYVLRTRESVLLNNAYARGPYSADEYIRDHRSRSILCIPLIKQATLIGILFLENRRISHVFTPERVAVLKLLASQAAVSLENARLFDDLVVAQENLKRLQAESQQTLDFIPALAWRTGADGSTEYLNKRWLEFTGMSLEQALGWQWLAAVHPDDRQGLSDTWKAIMASGRAGEADARLRRYDGEYRWFLFRADPVRDETGAIAAWYGTNTQIDDRKQAEIELLRSEAYSAEAQKLALTGSFAWGFVDDELFFSEETYNIMGIEPTVKPSLSFVLNHVVHPDDREQFQATARRALEGAHNFDDEWRFVMPDGQIKYVHVLAHRVAFESGKEEIVGAMADISVSKRAQEALHTAQAALAHASRVATLGEITATIAHEVNQPLSAIVTNGETSLRWLHRPEPNVGKVQELATHIVADARRASEIINRIRAMAARKAPEQTLIPLDHVIKESMMFLRHEFQSRGIAVSLDMSPGIPQVLADRTQLQQVIVNLVLNAVQAIAHAAGRRRSISIRTERSAGGMVCCMIEDSGPGIDPVHLPRLFAGFFTTKDAGMGIGLPISRSIVEAHGGDISADNNSALGGARIIFTLPVNDPANEAP